jgi:hypothetical protein
VAKKSVPAGTILCAGIRPKLRRVRTRCWTKAKQKKFLETLAESCNVTLAASKAKMSPSGAYKHRKVDAAFRAGWDEALAEGYATLELEMLKRALHGVEKVTTARSGEPTTIRHYDDRIGLALLRMHRDSVAATNNGVDETEVEEARARILERLSRIREKMEAVETKAAADAIELICWATGAR